MENYLEISNYSERVYRTLCCIVGDEETIDFYRIFSEISISEIIQFLEIITPNEIERYVQILFPPNDSEKDLPQVMRHVISGARMLNTLGINAYQITQILENLPAKLDDLRRLPSMFQKARSMVAGFTQEMPGLLEPFMRSIDAQEEEIANLMRKLDSAPNAYLRVFEKTISQLKDSLMWINSGSRAEGFDFKSSDYDVMITTSQIKVIQNSITESSNPPVSSLLMEKENTRPGFVRLKAIHDPGIFMFLFKSCNDSTYLSGRLLKDALLNLCRGIGFDMKMHGPCLSPQNDISDLAVTLCSDTWSQDANECVHRMLRCGWPQVSTVREIVRDGFLFVPIGCSKEYEDIEWRMSFSLAEKRLVHSMNHTQFLVYALLKLFLKEINEQNDEVKGLLCSYFMKTAVFWEIMETKIPWIPSCLLFHFWNCFRRLLGWVNCGYCPNFFIPENNMFFKNIHGHAQQKLLKHLGSLYREGHVVILKIQTFKLELDEWTGVPNESISRGLRRSEIIQKLVSCYSFSHSSDTGKLLKALDSSKNKIVSEFCQFLRLQKVNWSCNKALCAHSKTGYGNKKRTQIESSLIRVLRLSSPDSVRGDIFLAMYFYSSKKYDMSMRLLYKVLQIYDDEETFYTFAFDSAGYIEVGGDFLSVTEGMRRHMVSQVPVDCVTCIQEISNEFSFADHSIGCRFVPPLPLIHFVLFLCHFRMRDLLQARQQLTELENHNRYRVQEYRVEKDYRNGLRLSKEAISWELLGVGQKLIGDFRNALKSLKTCNKILLSDAQVLALNEHLIEANKKRIKEVEAILENT